MKLRLLCCYSATNQNVIIIEQDKPKGLRMIVGDNDRKEREKELNNKKRESYNMLLSLVVRMHEHAPTVLPLQKETNSQI